MLSGVLSLKTVRGGDRKVGKSAPRWGTAHRRRRRWLGRLALRGRARLVSRSVTVDPISRIGEGGAPRRVNFNSKANQVIGQGP